MRREDALRIPERGELVFFVREASAATAEWIDAVVDAAKRPFRLDEDDDWRHWVTRLCRVRYSYLAAHLPEETPQPPPPLERILTGELGRAWRERERARRAAAAADARFAELWNRNRQARPAQSQDWEDELAEAARDLKAAGPKPRRGRPVNLPLRLAVRALLRLFREAYGEEPTHTLNGPAVRFVTAFFDGTEGRWAWAPAKAWEKAGERILVISLRSSPVPAVPMSKAADAVRFAMLAEKRREFGGVYEHGGHWCPGYFEGEKLRAARAASPELFRLAESETRQ